MWNAGLIVITALGLVACGGGGEDSVDDVAAVTSDGYSVPPLPKAVPTDENARAPVGLSPVDPSKYQTEHDANAVYSYADLPMEGSYLKLNLEDLSDAQMNGVVHRLRTEFCTCGCPKDTIDQCLVNDPTCSTATTLAKQVIREERLKS